MADLSDNELFDSAISGTGNEPSSAPAVQQEQTPAQPRDGEGRFTSQEGKLSPAAAQPSTEQTPSETPAVGGNVPVGAVQAEREKRQAAQQEAEALRREIAELRGMVQATRQPTPQPQQEQQPASLWDDPDAYLKGQLSPVQQQMQETREMLWELQASQTHGVDKITAAKEAAAALAGTPQGLALHQQITASGNPYDNLVKWHQQQQVMSRIGTDPDAWLNAEIEKKLADPAFLASAIERARAGAVSQTGGRSQQPVTNLPPSLSRLPAGGNAPPANDQSDGALFSSVTSGRRG